MSANTTRSPFETDARVWVKRSGKAQPVAAIVVDDEGGAKVGVRYLDGHSVVETEVRHTMVSERVEDDAVDHLDDAPADEVPVRDVAEELDVPSDDDANSKGATEDEEVVAGAPEVDLATLMATDPAAALAALQQQLAAAQAQNAKLAEQVKTAPKATKRTPPRREVPVWPADKPAVAHVAPPEVKKEGQRACPVDFDRVAREARAYAGSAADVTSGWVEVLEASDKATTAGHIAVDIRRGRKKGRDAEGNATSPFGQEGESGANGWESKNVGERVFIRWVGTGDDAGTAGDAEVAVTEAPAEEVTQDAAAA